MNGNQDSIRSILYDEKLNYFISGGKVDENNSGLVFWDLTIDININFAVVLYEKFLTAA